MMRLLKHAAISVSSGCALLLFSALAAYGQMRDAQPPVVQSSGVVAEIPSPRGERCEALLKQSEESIGKQDFSSAIALAQRAAAVCEEQAAPLLLMARAQMLSHQFDAAEQSLSGVLKRDPHNVPALILLGQVEYLDNHDADAAVSFQKAIAAAPDKPDPHYWLGRLRYQDGKVEQANGEFQAALRIDPAYYKAYDGLGLCYEAMGENGHAAEAYLKAVDLVHKDHPDYDVVYADFAELLLKVGKDRQAFELAEEAASRNPRVPRNFFLAGKALERGDHDDDDALRWLLKAAQMDPDYADPHYLLARIYRREGKLDDANKEVATFKELSARAPKVRR